MTFAWLASSFILAIASVIKTHRNPETFRRTIITKLIMVAALLIFTAIMFPRSRTHKELAYRLVCGTNLKQLGVSALTYVCYYDDVVPNWNNWCDQLITEANIFPKLFICKGSDAIYGESSYALNENVIGKKLSELPKDMVLIFETNLGLEGNERANLLRERISFKESSATHKFFTGDEKVYLNRWNQVGGPDDLTLENHNGEGCNVGFVGGHVMFMQAVFIDKMLWSAE
jgi:prepilin-type processing-associated H-X9-DG protein